MVKWEGADDSARRRLAWKLMTSAAILCVAAGCTKTSKKSAPNKGVASINYSKQAQRPALKPNHPLHIATTHWARKHQRNPSDPTAAINYSRNLKALGAKDKAMEALARTYQLNPGHGKLASEYGRSALDLGKIQMAEQLLNQAMRSKGAADWRVLSALGTVNAKHGDHKKAQSYYHAALRQQPGATSVYNNLALSYALDGKAGEAEKLLKTAVARGHNTRRVRQNLALVLGLQSKFDEAQKIAKTDLASENVENDVAYLRTMVKNTKVAQVRKKSTPASKKAGTVTTASLPAKRTKVPARTTQTGKSQAIALSRAARAARSSRKQSAPITSKQPANVVKTVARAPTKLLPKHNKPTAQTKAATAPTPSWSTAVTGARLAPTVAVAQAAPKTAKFKVPKPE